MVFFSLKADRSSASFFFFQAEDGIRDPLVTGVQTCALPISPVLLTDDVLRLVLANVRTPRIRQGDLAAQAAAGRLAEGRLRELVARHGLELVLAAFDEVIAYAERRAREAIRR